MSTTKTSSRTNRELHVLRYVPVASPVHRAPAGVKLTWVVLLSLALTFRPGWPSLAVTGAVLFGTFLLARLPPTVLPRVPKIMIGAVLVSGVLAATAGGEPSLVIGGLSIEVGGLLRWVRLVLAVVILALGGLMLAWTTTMSDLARSFQRLFGPLRRIGLRIDGYLIALVLAARSIPLLIEELRMLFGAWRIRPRPESNGRSSVLTMAIDLWLTALTSSVRRATELGEALTARGIIAAPPLEQHRMTWHHRLAVFAAVVLATSIVVAF